MFGIININQKIRNFENTKEHHLNPSNANNH